MGSDESPFNASFTVRGKVTKAVSTDERIEKREGSRKREEHLKREGSRNGIERERERDPRRRGGGGGGGKKETLHRHHQNDSCVQIGSYEIHFNVPLIARDKVTIRQCPHPTSLKRDESRSGIEPRSFMPTSLKPRS